MRSWTLRKISTNEVKQVFFQETAPTEEYLSAFRTSGDPDFSLTDRVLSYNEELEYILARRAEEYPTITELGDAIWHQQNGNETRMTEYLAKCTEVKTRWPKPPIP